MSTLLNSSNAEYHANRTHLSSSGLKLLLKDPKEFYDKYVSGTAPPEPEKAAFTEGTFTHSLILEPEKVLTDYAVFPGLRKVGKDYDKFLADPANANKLVITVPQVDRCQKLYKAFKNHEQASNLISGGASEVTLTSMLQETPVKARTDYIVKGQYIVDVKTTAYPSDTELFKQTVREYSYDLSASLYKSIADEQHNSAHDFYWLVLSKADFQCRLYKAKKSTLENGAIQVGKALQLYKQCLSTGIWKLNNHLSLVAQQEYEEV